jgi:hypothetical protein
VFPAAENAGAENALTVADVQCIVVGARLSESADQTQSQSGEMILTYYLGRIDGRSPNVDLQELIERAARSMTTSDYARAARRCGTEFSARGAAIVRIGKALEEIGK